MSKDHAHALPAERNERSLTFALVLTGGFLIAEVVAGIVTGSLALVSDAAHMFTDAAALAIALAAIRVGRRPADRRRTFGYQRFEILAAAFNAVLLFFVALYILYEAYDRLKSPVEIKSIGMLIVASIGLIVNFASIRLLSGGKDLSLNIKGAYLEVWSDLLGSVGVIVGAVVIMLTGWGWVDPAIAVAIGVWVLPRTWILLKDSLNILLEGVPAGINMDAVAKAISETQGVRDVHDLHVWAVTSGVPSLTAHVVVDSTKADGDLVPRLAKMLADRFEIRHTTIQCEREPCADAEHGHRFI